MNNENITLEFLDIKNYWMTLFPEINSEDEFNGILRSVSNTCLEDLQFEINEQQSLQAENLIDNIFSCEQMALLNEHSTKFKNEFPFYDYFKPILNFYSIEFYNKLSLYTILNNIDDFFTFSVESLLNSLSSTAQRTLIFEVNIARMNNELRGETPEERFLYFSNVLLEDCEFLKSLYHEYSVLTKLICSQVKQFFDFHLEIISSTQSESAVLSNKFNNDISIGKIIKVNTDMGDTHKGGKAVAMINFDSEFKIMYKPRCLDLEEGFQLLSEWLNKQNIEGVLKLKTAKVHTKNNYGWMEFIEYKECTSSEEIKNYYTRTGHLLAMLYSFNAQDFHHENLIANSEYPVLIDLESLFHSFLQTKNAFFSESTEIAQKILSKSVYSVGLLPQRITNRVDNNDISVEFSGLGAEEEQVAPFKSFVIKNKNSDSIEIEKELSIIIPQQNNPKISGKVQRSDAYISEIKSGFTLVYNWVMQNKKQFADKVDELFSGKKSRFILRPTYLYGQLLRTSYHPDFLREEIHRRILLHRIGIKANERIKALLAAELKDLLLGDVPYFSVLVDSDIIIDSNNKEYNNFFDLSPLADVKEKILSFCEFDLQRQLHIIDIAYLAKNNDARKDITNTKFSLNINHNKFRTNEWLKLAEHIGEYLIQNSIAGKDDITWISTILEGREEVTWGLAPVGNDLYTGNCGIALFLGYLGKITGRNEFTQASLNAMNAPINEMKDLIPDHPYLVGAYNGLSGYFYAFSKLGKVIPDKKFEDALWGNIGILKNLASKDKAYEVIGGTGGSLGVVLSIFNDTNNENHKNLLLDIAYENYRHLESSCKQISNECIAWESDVTVPSTGFSHGNAGIIAYLGRLYAVTSNAEVKSLLIKALRFERELFSEEHKNWFSSQKKDRISLGWCHGAPGILLSRLILKNSGYEDAYINDEIKIALKTTIENGFGHNPSFCHGDLGNLEILKYAAVTLQDNNLKNQCYATFQDLFNSVLVKRWNNGVLRGTESVSLMVGVAGFGYSILRHYEPELVPEILWFE